MRRFTWLGGLCAAWALVLAGLTLGAEGPSAQAAYGEDSGELVWVTEGNRLRLLDPDTVGAGLLQKVLIPSAEDDVSNGRDSNGQHCELPDGSGGFVLAEDTGQPHPPPGWGIFSPSGRQVGKLAATYPSSGPEPFGCAFAPDGTLFTTEVGDPATNKGQLMMWFAPYEGYPGAPGEYPDTDAVSTNFCKLDTNLGTAGEVEVDSQGRVYVAASSSGAVYRYSPPFPTGPDAQGGCGAHDGTGAPMAYQIHKEALIRPDLFRGMLTFSGLAFSDHGTLFVSSVATGHIAEYDLMGRFLRHVVKPSTLFFPSTYGNPQGIDVGSDGTLYYADMALTWSEGFPGPGPNGKLRRVRFAADGEPRRPEVVLDGLAFPDAVTVHTGNLEETAPDPPRDLGEWRHYAGGPTRNFHNDADPWMHSASVEGLRLKWRKRTGRIVTAQPTVAAVDIPGEGPTQVVYVPGWDWKVYALRLRDGAALWEFETAKQPGASLPAASSADVTSVDGRDVVFVATGETMYALDAVSGTEIWRFEAGTGCRDANGNPPGDCGFGRDGAVRDERNEIESSPLVVDGRVYFGMDVNDFEVGKGGFYALDARSGTLAWFLDLQTGMTCTPFDSDAISRFDGYHSEEELRLPDAFLSTRPGCDFADVVAESGVSSRTGCENVWSSPAWDANRELMYFAVSNCETDTDPESNSPPPPMPRFDESVVAVDPEGRIAWHWRPREVDNADLAFGAVPNLFSIRDGGDEIDVVGIGNKDGTYYVVDRDGINERNGALAGTPDTAELFPYWQTKVVPGGDIGGIIGTSSAVESTRRIHVGTAAGTDPLRPQQPTMHTLDMDTGEVVWQSRSSDFLLRDWTAAPTSSVNDVVFFGSATTATLRSMRAGDGRALLVRTIADGIGAIASPSIVVDGTLVVGTGIGSLSGDPSDISNVSAAQPSDIVALCVPGAPDCPDERGVTIEVHGARPFLVEEGITGVVEVATSVLGPVVHVDGLLEHTDDPVRISVECAIVCGGSIRVGRRQIPVMVATVVHQGELPDSARFAGAGIDVESFPWQPFRYSVEVREG